MPRGKQLSVIALEDVPGLWADGLSALEIAKATNTPIRTVRDWLQREDVKAQCKAELEFRDATRRREWQRHYHKLYDFAAAVALGEAKIESPEQWAALKALTELDGTTERRLEEVREQPQLPTGEAPMLPAGPITVNLYSQPPASTNGHGPIIDLDEEA